MDWMYLETRKNYKQKYIIYAYFLNKLLGEKLCPLSKTHLYPFAPYSKILDQTLTYSWPGLENLRFLKKTLRF